MDKLLLLALTLGISITGLSIGATVPLVALRLFQAGHSNLLIGLLSALPAVGIMLSAFLVERIGLRLSRRHTYLACFVLSGLSIAATEVCTASLYVLALARFLMGLSAGVIIILGEAWVNEIAHDAYRGRVVSVYTTSFTVFQLLGPGMVSLFGSHSPLVSLTVLAGHVLAIVLIWLHLHDPAPVEAHVHSRTFTLLSFLRVAPALCMGIVFFAFFDSVILSLFPVYAVHHGHALQVATLMSTVILLGDAIFQFPLGWLSDLLAKPKIYLSSGLVALAIGLALPWLITQPLLLWPSLMVLGAVAGGIYTLAIILIGERFRGPDLVTANASAGFLWGLGSSLGPLLSGAAMALSPQGLPTVLCLASGLFVLFAWSYFKAATAARTA